MEDYIKPIGMSVRTCSLALHVPYSRLRKIVDGKYGVSADTALRPEPDPSDPIIEGPI
jgi:plasmid maintenance system antidote protein VapI